jgi:hypothetical protein
LQELVLLSCLQPVTGSQESSVQTLLSSQFNNAPPQAPPAQVSLVVHAFPSSQGSELLALVHPVAESHPSSVQGFPSLQFGGAPPTQTPRLQTSFVVQALPSLQEALLLENTQPCTGSHVSVVQTLPSLHTGAAPPTQAPAEQVSFVVQALPSLHAAVLFTCTQPSAGLQESSVQTLPSSQLGGGPPTQAPKAQASLVVHAFPSLHDAVLLANTQTPPWHESVVHTLLSSH